MIKNNFITVSIKNGNHKITINGKQVDTYSSWGIHVSANEIASIPIKDLAYFRPILVEFDDKFCKKNHIDNLFNIVASITINEENEAETFVTFMDPSDISGKEARELFQTTLEKVVEEDEYTFLYEPVKAQYSEAELLEVEKSKKLCADLDQPYDHSDVGFVQFMANIVAQTFGELFVRLSHLIRMLDTKTRVRIKRGEQLINESTIK